jgi:nicotinate-nucleotide adenylyltransferase
MTAPPRRIGILGGTFDPIHCGHVDLAVAAESALQLTRTHVIAASIPPHRHQPVASAYHRFAMVAMTVADHPTWRASDLELRFLTPSYTATTLQRFRSRGYAPVELFFLVGADAFAEIGSWRDYPALLNAAHFGVVSRPGHPVDELSVRMPALAEKMIRCAPGERPDATTPMIFLIDAPTADVSSTAIRRRVAARESIAGMVPRAVQQHVEQHALYTSVPPGRRASDAPAAPGAGRLHGKD